MQDFKGKGKPKGKGKGKVEDKGKGKGKGASGKADKKGKGAEKGKTWQEENHWQDPKGKGKTKESPIAVLTRLLERKSFKDAVLNLTSTTALQPGDFDNWVIKVLDNIEECFGNCEEACQMLKDNLGDRVREQIRQPKAYIFSLLTKFKNEQKTIQQRGGKSSFNPFAAEFVPGGGSSFAFNADTPEFVPSASATESKPFSADAPEFVPGQSFQPSTPETRPKGSPALTPEKSFTLKDGTASPGFIKQEVPSFGVTA